MWPFQEELVKLLHNNRFVINRLSRQCGKSTTVLAYLLHVILFSDDQSICILANKANISKKLLGDLKKSYMAIPKWMQQGVTAWNKFDIELENGSKITASSTSSDAIRGNSFNIIVLDEFAFVPAHIAEEFFESVYPTISSGETTKIFIISTPKGHNKFYKMWTEACHPRDSTNKQMQWNGYVPFTRDWRAVPGRGEKWKQDTIARIGPAAFRQEFEVEFIGSSDTLLSADQLNNMTWKSPIAQRRLRFDNTALLDVHVLPIERNRYVLVADVAGGGEGDFSAFTIIDITEVPYRVVAKYRSNKIRPALYADVLGEIGILYNNAFILVEINDLGGEVAKTLQQDLEYENIIMTTTKGRNGPEVGGGFGKSTEMGVRTTKTTKRQGCITLKTLMELDKLVVEDYEIYEECTRFIANTKGSFSAEPGGTDDLMMTLVNFGWLSTQRYFKDLTDTDFYLKLRQETEAKLDDVFFGFFMDGITDNIEDDGFKL
jgi:hypothetical protein